ncbi:unnamed protein product [Schistocephalus solidus]|uniref:C2H2-type domain-containing protein n=1 Tax=Schistocephalus solidus TaxID=70667 RepID=A0A183S7I2_SCHSO|nr:unnamed protein product [Schistocephalus solidus]
MIYPPDSSPGAFKLAASASLKGSPFLPPRTNTANAQALPTCPRCQRSFRARIGLVGYRRTQCTNKPKIPTFTPNSANPPSASHSLPPGINSITPTIIETTPHNSSPVTSTTTTTISDEESLLNCTHRDRTLTSRISLVGHLRIHCTEAGEPVPGVPTYSRRARLHCPNCSRTFTPRIGLLGYMHLHDNLR